jgi:pimeloyl-ACP methyl ester carboxylesterase
MAAAHVATIQEHTPHGPYYLGGYCIGAIVAIEIARQLAEQGEKVIHLLLIDPTPLGSPWLRWIWLGIDNVGEIRDWNLRRKVSYFDRYAVPLNRWLVKSTSGKFDAIRNRLGLARRTAPSAPTETQGPAGEDQEILSSPDYEVYMLAFRLCRLRPVPVPATFYLPAETAPSRLARVYRLREFFPAVAVETVPGNHRTCIIDHATPLGHEMKKAIGLA